MSRAGQKLLFVDKVIAHVAAMMQAASDIRRRPLHGAGPGLHAR
jgi:hypothetical protein